MEQSAHAQAFRFRHRATSSSTRLLDERGAHGAECPRSSLSLPPSGNKLLLAVALTIVGCILAEQRRLIFLFLTCSRTIFKRFDEKAKINNDCITFENSKLIKQLFVSIE
jgi:hypothetical protein